MDGELRERSRAARRSPDDAEAALAHALALERAGDRRGATHELARATRLGSAAARERLDAWTPWPGEGGVRDTRTSRAVGLRTTPVVRSATLESVRFDHVVAASARAIFVRGEEGLDLDAGADMFEALRGVLAGIAIDDLALRFRVATPGGVATAHAALGDDLVRAEDRALVLHDGETGAALAQATLPGRVSKLAVEGDRGLVALFGRPPFLGVDLAVASFGRTLWEASPPEASIPLFAHLRAGCAFVSGFASPAVAVLEAGTRAATVAFARGEQGHVRTSDALGVLLSGFQGEASFLEERGLDGRPRWRREGVFPIPLTAVAPEAVVAILGGDVTSVAAIDRETGEDRWRKQLAGGAGDDVIPSFGLVVARDVVYVGIANGKGVAVVGLDLVTGKRLFAAHAPVELETAPYVPGPGRGVSAFGVVPLDGAVALLARPAAGGTFVAIVSG